ncbi:MAG: pyrroline-5-carboxylate reductase [Planctomycetota bacterium]|nr:MAG: pyrroline-5-carboxylate reductase [Planctomycetota bacterium]
MNTPLSSPLPAIACIGGGNMGQAIIAGLLQLDHPPHITVIDPSPEVAERFHSNGTLAQSVTVSAQPEDVSEAEIVLFAVKPQLGAQVAASYAPYLHHDHLLVSILAGVSCAGLREWFPQVRCVVRTMPNTPMMVGSGMVGVCSDGVSEEDLQRVEAVFQPAAVVMRLAEKHFDVLTALSGSGPAYVFHFAEGLYTAAIKAGIPQETARILVRQTLFGSARFLDIRDKDSCDFVAPLLREQVTSPGGTTAAALEVLSNNDWNSHLQAAVQAAAHRSQELRES